MNTSERNKNATYHSNGWYCSVKCYLLILDVDKSRYACVCLNSKIECNPDIPRVCERDRLSGRWSMRRLNTPRKICTTLDGRLADLLRIRFIIGSNLVNFCGTLCIHAWQRLDVLPFKIYANECCFRRQRRHCRIRRCCCC